MTIDCPTVTFCDNHACRQRYVGVQRLVALLFMVRYNTDHGISNRALKRRERNRPEFIFYGRYDNFI